MVIFLKIGKVIIKQNAGTKIVPVFADGCGPGRIRTCDQAVMHPTTAFAALFRFVGWTIPSPYSRVPAI
jgi:hypothetical protein